MDARFSSDGSEIHLLSTAGQLEIRNLQGEKSRVIEGPVRFQFMLDSSHEDRIYLGSSSRVWAYAKTTGQLLWETPALLVDRSVTVDATGVPTFKVSTTDLRVSGSDTGWTVLRTETGFQKIPRDLADYLDVLNVRELTEDEKERLIGIRQ